MREASFAAMKRAAQNNSSKVVTHASPDLEGKPNSVGKKYGKNGQLEQERYYGPDGRAVKDKDLTNHGNSKRHPKVPHEHDWDWSVDPPKRGPAYSIPLNNIGKGVAVVVGGYIIYRGVRMIPSILPPLWWTIPANAVCP
ncbi:hypothetical protein [Clostridium sp. JNZ J1-5]